MVVAIDGHFMVRSEALGRSGILVLGMHRSGTSALTGVLAALGVVAPKTQISGDKWNSRGYWESARINHFNERLLSAAGSAWDDWSRFDPGSLDARELARFATESNALLRSEFGNEKLFAIKDPRICRIVPFWLEALRAFEASPIVILAVRHPVEVAGSLQSRDQMSYIDGVMLWLRSILDAEHESRGLGRSFTRYDDLLNDWRSAVKKLSADIGLVWPVSPDHAATEIEKFISSDLRHNTARSLHDIDLPDVLSGWASDVWEIVSGLAGDLLREEDVYSRLDGIRAEFASYCDAVLVEREKQNTRSNVSRADLNEARKHGRKKGFLLSGSSVWFKNHRRYWIARFLLLAAPAFSSEYTERLRRRLERYEAQGRIERKTSS